MDKLTKKLLVILVVAAMVFALPLAVLAEDVATEVVEAEEAVVEEPVAEAEVLEEVSETDVAEDCTLEENTEEADAPEEAPEEEYPVEVVAMTADDFEGIDALAGIQLQDVLDGLQDALNEIRDRVEADFAYILAAPPGTFPGNPADLDAIMTAWDDDWFILDTVFDNWDAIIDTTMALEGMTYEEAVEFWLGILFAAREEIELFYLDLLRQAGFDVVGYCDNCGPDSPVGCDYCFCYLCRGHSFNDPDSDCRFCQSQEDDGTCDDCGNPWYECTCGTNIVPCPICGELGCTECVEVCDGCGNNPCTCCVCFACNCEDCQCTDTDCCDICAGRITGGGTPAPGPVVVVAPQTGDTVQASLPLAALVLSSSVFLGGGLLRKRPKQD